MAPEPLTRLALAATSVVDDLGFVALADLSRALQADAPADYRVIGGHMVTALVARWGLGVELYRETGDTDLGVPPAIVRDLSLSRPSLDLELTLRRLNGETLEVPLAIADEVSALVLKAVATTVRSKDTDIVDVWRCLEVAYAAGLGPGDFEAAVAADAVATVRQLFDSRDGVGIEAIVREQRLSSEAADARFTRIRALVDRVLG